MTERGRQWGQGQRIEQDLTCTWGKGSGNQGKNLPGNHTSQGQSEAKLPEATRIKMGASLYSTCNIFDACYLVVIDARFLGC